MTVTLRNGAQIAIRPITPEDRAALATGFERLSPESRYRRFFASMSELSERDLTYLTEVDHHDHEALVAIDDETGDGVGVARYVRTSAEAAEPALVVADDWQGRGVGTALLSALVERAREEGVVRFEALVLSTNREAISVLARVGETTKRPDGPEMMLTIELPDSPASAPRWAELLSQFATGTVQPARALMQLLWPRRQGSPADERLNVIVVGSDGSDSSQDAVEAAALLATASGASVHLLGVHRLLTGQEAGLTDAVRGAAESLRERGVEVQEQIRRGDPALVLSDFAAEQNARLIVVGAGKRGKTARRIIGGVADLVAERSPCSVLIVRPRET